ncbi:MAG: protein translocase subunit SecD [Acidobacteria bacterium]|nr:protein translocase subunit SecD [Acidobacteriota bacterium]MBI3488590.1 protein translocase subunit SecD [Acidobacteriota bacterium]
MSKHTYTRLAWVMGICLACAYFFIPLSKVRLGLDLKGGVHYELEVQGQEALQRDLEETRDRVQDTLRGKGLTAAAVHLEGGRLRLAGVSKQAMEKGLSDLRGYALSTEGEAVLLTQKADHQQAIKASANQRALQIIETRVNQFGVVEPEITSGGPEGNRIIVELPGVTEADRERIKSLLSTPGRLELRLLAKTDAPYFPTEEEARAHFNGPPPEGTELFPEPLTERSASTGQREALKNQKRVPIRRWVLLESKVQLDGSSITDAQRSQSELGNHEVNFTLNTQGAEANARVTGIAANEGRLFAFVLDKKIISVLSAKEKIVGGAVRISGEFTAEEADDLALKLRSGALRASMKVLEERVVGPSLGQDSINQGVGASLVGFGVIVAFMVFWYRWSGVNAVVALVVNIVVMLGLLGSFRATITLPGIAGFALTVGMAVDANILIFERIKEELALGKTPAKAIHAGFERVFWTIVDSHVTQLFAAILLFIFGTGPVKGFAVSLTVGVAASLFTSIYISRYIYEWILERSPAVARISIGAFSLFKSTDIDFMKYKKTALALSWGLILMCVVVIRPWRIEGNERIKLGMQFVGGTDMTVRFLRDIDAAEVRTALAKDGFTDASVVSYQHADPSVREFSIKVRADRTREAADSIRQSARIRATLTALDAEPGGRNSLNLEGAGALAEALIRANPLHVGGDAEAAMAVYEDLAGRLTAARERLPLGLYRSYAELPENLPPEVKGLVEREYRLGQVGILKDESFAPSISGEWTKKTLAAVGWAMGAILVYVIFRFTTAFAVGGIVALVHDMLMALVLFTIMGYEFNVPVVASFLTLMGYSMADTIVVFDRIRENSHKPEYKRTPMRQIINDSINQTLSRTILTSLSVLFVSVCLWLWGGPALRDLAFPLVIGVITGTFSSIYIASPVVEWWQRFSGRREALAKE